MPGGVCLFHCAEESPFQGVGIEGVPLECLVLCVYSIVQRSPHFRVLE